MKNAVLPAAGGRGFRCNGKATSVGAAICSVSTLSGTLDALANDPRFKDDEELRMAVAIHPRVSMATAEKVTANFKLPQLKKLLAKPGLNQHLREKLFKRTVLR
jgi:hypothetical protein